MPRAQVAVQKLLTEMDAIIGGRTQRDFRRFVLERWAEGSFSFQVRKEFCALLDELVALYDAGELDATDCYQPGQLPASNATLYTETYAIRMVRDSPDGAPRDQPISEYNIEPHIHFVPSIVIVANRPNDFVGRYVLHRLDDETEYVASVPLEFGNLVCFPENISHTFKPSDTGLFTINMTERLIIPQTSQFGADAPISMDNLPVVSVT